MNPDNKCFLNFLRENDLLIDSDNVVFANNAFKIHSIVNGVIRESKGTYQSKEDFLSKVDLIECLMENNKKSSQSIDKKQTQAYINTSAQVQAPTAVKAPTTSVPVPAPARTHVTADKMLDKWMI
jgi:hypothetical protein